MAASTGLAKYEQVFHSIVWGINQLPKRDQAAYRTHIFACKISILSYDLIPENFELVADVEHSILQHFYFRLSSKLNLSNTTSSGNSHF